jgi:hypothetical protein
MRAASAGYSAWRKPSSKNVAVEWVALNMLRIADVYWLGPSSKVRYTMPPCVALA